jgi:acyl-[acyl-carrier-protein]-phospholipid O-acyltransferase / long-chain-fatty-acid--[acyl-carrier-protein] ligase
MKALFRFLLRLCFRFRAYNTEVLKTPGPVLLVPNHVSWLDWLYLYVVLEDDWKFVASSTTANLSWIHRKIVYSKRTFPIDPTSPYAVRTMAEHLEKGGRLVLFAEGRISTTGALMKLFDGTGFLIRKTNAKVITCYLRGANRVRWVRHTGWTKLFPRVSAHFSAIQRAPSTAGHSHSEARVQLTQWLRDRMVAQQFEVELAFGGANVLAAIAETAKQIPRRIALEDATSTALTYRRLMVGVDVLAGAWPAHLGEESETDLVGRGIPAEPRLSEDASPYPNKPASPKTTAQMAPHNRVGVLLPNVNAMPVTVLSLWAAGKTPTILNFSSGVATMLGCAQLASLTHVITSRAFLERAKLDLAPFTAAGLRLVYLEDVRQTIGRTTKIGALLRHAVAPGRSLRRCALRADDTAVVLFTSGSESTPKGVELTHANLLANIRQALAVMDLTDNDRFFNALPLFHSFGLTGGTLLPLVRGCYTLLYPSPVHYRVIPTMIYERNCTVLLATNTFLSGYGRKGHPYDFRTLRYLIAGAEKVQAATLDTWTKKFGVRILEGYGATECSPIISINTWIEPSVGSAGRLLPGMEYRLEPIDGITEGGRLFVRGPNVMKGYLNGEANERFKTLNGWYDTGDIAEVDTLGFLHLRGRMKRFAKVSGEMVSLTAVEDALAGAFPQYGPRCEVAIITRPDADKGEALIAVTNEPRLQLPEIRAAVRAKGLSNLAAPRELHAMRSIPKLGTGKVNHRELTRVLAETRAPQAAVVER